VSIAHGSEILGAAHTAPGNYDTSITPAATPNAVCVIPINSTSVSDVITSAAYGIAAGAVTLTRRRFDTEATEPGGVYIYWAAGVFPSGAQTVRIIRTGTDNLRVAISTMTVTDPVNFTVAVDSDATGTSASVANPSWSHTSLVNNVVAYEGIHSGLQTMTNTPATNWTLAPTPGFEDVGVIGRGWARRVLATAGALAPGWIAATADDFVGSSVAFKEVPITTQIAGHITPVIAGRLVTPARDAPTILGG
jgi:hypothetical protein